jgi:hypothetical protein
MASHQTGIKSKGTLGNQDNEVVKGQVETEKCAARFGHCLCVDLN